MTSASITLNLATVAELRVFSKHFQDNIYGCCKQLNTNQISTRFDPNDGPFVLQNNPENQKDAKLYKVVLSAYVTALFKQNTVLEMFLESHRSRSGKIQRSDEAFFDTLINTHLQENSNKHDLIFVPVTINYDRVIEGEILPLDLLGNILVQPASQKLCMDLDMIVKNKDQFALMKSNFSQSLLFAQVDNLVIMTTSIVAAIILTNRKGIAKDLLSIYQQHDQAMKSVMMLSYYRNHLVHLFITDAEIASALFALKFEEFVLKDRINSQQQLSDRLDFLSVRGFFTKQGDQIHVENDDQGYKLGFLCSLIHPYVDTYAIALAYFSIPQHLGMSHDEQYIYSKIQWVLTTLYEKGLIPHSESCMIESIRNAVRKFKALGILTSETVQVKKNAFQHFLRVKKPTQAAQQQIQALYEGIAYYTATPIQNYVQIQTEIKKLTVSELIARL